jgi:hypothetical protein
MWSLFCSAKRRDETMEQWTARGLSIFAVGWFGFIPVPVKVSMYLLYREQKKLREKGDCCRSLSCEGWRIQIGRQQNTRGLFQHTVFPAGWHRFKPSRIISHLVVKQTVGHQKYKKRKIQEIENPTQTGHL